MYPWINLKYVRDKILLKYYTLPFLLQEDITKDITKIDRHTAKG